MPTTIKARNEEDKKGDTTAKGSFNIIKEDDGNVTITLNFSVKRTGIHGTGQGVMSFALLGKNDKEPLYRFEKGFTVGAELDGEHTKDHKEVIDFYQWDQVRGSAFTVNATMDTTGLPEVGDITHIFGGDIISALGGLAIGESTSINGWVIDLLQ